MRVVSVSDHCIIILYITSVACYQLSFVIIHPRSCLLIKWYCYITFLANMLSPSWFRSSTRITRGGGGGEVKKKSHTGRLRTEVQPLTLLYTNVDRTFAWLFHSHKMHLLAVLGLFTNQNTYLPYTFIYFEKWNPCPLIYRYLIPRGWIISRSSPLEMFRRD